MENRKNGTGSKRTINVAKMAYKYKSEDASRGDYDHGALSISFLLKNGHPIIITDYIVMKVARYNTD